jgi:anti-sigma regulatory factor (Ser/Thr protein kinase)
MIARIVKAGLSGALSQGLMFLRFFCINILVLGTAGQSGMVAFSVCISCFYLSTIGISGVSQAMMPIVSVLYGEEDYTGIRLVVRRAACVIMAITVVLVALLQLFPDLLLFLFGVREAETTAIAVPGIRLYALSLLGVAGSYIMLFYLTAVNRTGMATALSAIEGFFLIVPLAWILSIIMGLQGIMLAFSLAEVLSIAIILGLAYRAVAKADGRLRGVLMLPETQIGMDVLDVTIRSVETEAFALSRDIGDFCAQNGISGVDAANVCMIAEAFLLNIIRHGHASSDRHVIDVSVKAQGENIRMTFRDDGPAFDPYAYWGRLAPRCASEDGQADPHGLALLKRLSAGVEYSYSLGFNSTAITSRKAMKP